ncbi:MAG: LLM class F420-dependent oxidoreductase [Halobacteriales archaeon SW_8_66_22]|nr:MAG: LLM class F420-dependent oxidoreductase [Halobacteriales archaeon SW_8_66_22]
MVSVDYMAHQEQYSPSELLRFTELAEEAGYEFVWTSDHFHPWFHTDGEAGFAWSWLGAASQRTDLPIGTYVTPAAQHYHPGRIAQAFATIGEMHDERVVLGLSTGEAMNEKPLGQPWDDYPVRRDRLEETLEVVLDLYESEGFVDYDGDFFSLDGANLYTMPESRPEVHVAANGPSTARLAARYADGFMTVITGEEFTERLYPAVRKYAREEGRDPDGFETTVLVIVSYDEDYEAAVDATRPWWATTQDVFDRAIADPREIEQLGKQATREEIEEKFLIADDPATIAAEIEKLADQGFDRIALANTSPEPERLFEVMGKEVIPSV